MKEQHCKHPLAYVVGESDLTDPSDDRYHWECAACEERGEEVNNMDVAAASLQASREIKH